MCRATRITCRQRNVTLLVKPKENTSSACLYACDAEVIKNFPPCNRGDFIRIDKTNGSADSLISMLGAFSSFRLFVGGLALYAIRI